MSSALEAISGPLEPEQIWQEVHEIAALFQRLQAENLAVSYGFDCNLDFDAVYQDIKVKAELLPDFVGESIANGIYCLEKNDFYVECKSLAVQFLLRRDRTIRLTADNQEVIDFIKANWVSKRYPTYQKPTRWVSIPAPGPV